MTQKLPVESVGLLICDGQNEKIHRNNYLNKKNIRSELADKILIEPGRNKIEVGKKRKKLCGISYVLTPKD
jgi:hypothetical protein